MRGVAPDPTRGCPPLDPDQGRAPGPVIASTALRAADAHRVEKWVTRRGRKPAPETGSLARSKTADPASCQPSRALDEGAWTQGCAGGTRSGHGRGAGGAWRP